MGDREREDERESSDRAGPHRSRDRTSGPESPGLGNQATLAVIRARADKVIDVEIVGRVWRAKVAQVAKEMKLSPDDPKVRVEAGKRTIVQIGSGNYRNWVKHTGGAQPGTSSPGAHEGDGTSAASPSRAELEKRAQELRTELYTGEYVRDEETKQTLRDELAAVLAAIEALSPIVNPGIPPLVYPGLKPLGIDFSAGHNPGGIGAEELVQNRFYPGSTRMPAKFEGVDFIEGGQSTPLTGMQPTKNLPFTQDSVTIEGGDLIQLKTLRNLLPTYQKKRSIVNALTGAESGGEKLSGFDTPYGHSARSGNEYYRVETTGTPGRRILHVEFQAEPTPAQYLEIAEVDEKCASLGMELVTNWPNKGGVQLSPDVIGGIGVGVAVVGAVGRQIKKERDFKEEGYAAVGTAAYQDAGILSRLASFFRGDMIESLTQTPGEVNVPVWRADLRKRVSGAKVGVTYNLTIQIESEDGRGTTNTHAIYQKQDDGSWKLLEYDGPKSITPPDLDRCLDPAVGDSTVKVMLTPSTET